MLTSTAHRIRCLSRYCAMVQPRRQQHTQQNHVQSIVSSALQQLSASIARIDADHIRRYGFMVIDNAIGREFCHALVDEMNALHNADALMLNHTHLVNSQRSVNLLPKTGIFETKPHYDDGSDIAPFYQALCDDTSILHAVTRALPFITFRGHSVKLQVNVGENSCFPLHFDADWSVRGDRRLLTIVAYLNNDWRCGDGGELRLYPFPYETVDIAPTMDRIVIFPSTTMLHRVLPTNKRRYCFSIWMSAKTEQQTTNMDYSADIPANLDTSDERVRTIASAMRRLFHERVYAHYCKLLYCNEWKLSLKQSHNVQSEETIQMLQRHDADLQVIARALGPLTEMIPNGLLPLPLPQTALSTPLNDPSYPLVPVHNPSPVVNDEMAILRDRLHLNEWNLHQFI